MLSRARFPIRRIRVPQVSPLRPGKARSPARPFADYFPHPRTVEPSPTPAQSVRDCDRSMPIGAPRHPPPTYFRFPQKPCRLYRRFDLSHKGSRFPPSLPGERHNAGLSLIARNPPPGATSMTDLNSISSRKPGRREFPQGRRSSHSRSAHAFCDPRRFRENHARAP